MVLLILGVLWLAVLAPPVVRYVTGDRRRADSVGDFNDTLTVLGRAQGDRGARRRAPDHTGGNGARPSTAHSRPRTPPPAPLGRPGVPSAAQRRRRDILFGLAGSVGVTFVLAIVVGGTVVWGVQIVADVLLAAYVTLLVQHRQRALERRTKVRHLPSSGPRDELAMRRVVSGR